MKSKDEKMKYELSLNFNKQLIQAILQHNELQKKQKLAAIHLKIKTLQIIKIRACICILSM